jgi:hypothetical protein
MAESCLVGIWGSVGSPSDPLLLKTVILSSAWTPLGHQGILADHLCVFQSMSKQSNHIQVFRKRGRNEHGGILYGDQETFEDKLPIIVEYVSLFSKTQIDDALRQLFASDVDIETKLLFENTSHNDQVKQRLLASVKFKDRRTVREYPGPYVCHPGGFLQAENQST